MNIYISFIFAPLKFVNHYDDISNKNFIMQNLKNLCYKISCHYNLGNRNKEMCRNPVNISVFL